MYSADVDLRYQVVTDLQDGDGCYAVSDCYRILATELISSLTKWLQELLENHNSLGDVWAQARIHTDPAPDSHRKVMASLAGWKNTLWTRNLSEIPRGLDLMWNGETDWVLQLGLGRERTGQSRGPQKDSNEQKHEGPLWERGTEREINNQKTKLGKKNDKWKADPAVGMSKCEVQSESLV